MNIRFRWHWLSVFSYPAGKNPRRIVFSITTIRRTNKCSKDECRYV